MMFVESILNKTILPVFLLVALSLIGRDLRAQSDQDCQNNPDAVRLVLPDEISGQPGDIVCLDLVVNGFDNVTIFLFTINFSSNFLRFDSANPLVSGLPSFSPTDIIPPFGPDDLDLIRVLWAQPNAEDESLADGTVLIELCFEITGTPGQTGVVHINSSGLNGVAEFVSSAGVNLPLCIEGNGTQIPIEAPPSPNPQAFITSNCGTPQGLSEGVAEIAIFNGTQPYTVIDDLGNRFQLANGINRFVTTGLNIGSRIYRVSDANGTLSEAITITTDNIPPFDISATLVEPDCPLDNDGRILLNVTGGTPYQGNEYYYDWGTSQVGLGQNELKNITNGIYNVSIIDSLGCVQQETFVLQRSDIQLETVNVNDALCNGRANGSITVRATGGGPFAGGRYTFTIEGTTTDGQNYLDSRQEVQQAIFSNLPPGEYMITAQDSVDRRMNCADQQPFIIGTQQSISTVIMHSSNATCVEGEQFVDFTIVGNSDLNLPIDVVITDSSGTEVPNSPYRVNSATFAGECLPQGRYDLTLRDIAGCTYDTTFSILGCTITIQDTMITIPQCAGDATGSITVSASSMNGPVAFSWSNGATTPTVDMLTAGNYSVTITDQDDCEVFLNFVIPAPDNLDVTLTVDPILCRGFTGVVRAQPSGGTEPYAYQWFPNPIGTTQSTLSNVPPGIYRVIVTDANNCSVTDSIELVEPGAFSIDTSNIQPPVCAGEATGTAVINAFTNEFYSAPFSYLASTGLRGTGANFSVDNFPAGTNWVLVSDGVCVSDTIYIEIPPQDHLRLDTMRSVVPDVSCFGDGGDNGAIVNLVGTGGNGSAITRYIWPELGPDVVGNVQIGLAAGDYSVILENAAACRDTVEISISQPDSLEVELDPLNSTLALCGGDSDAQLSIRHLGGIEDGSFIYRWEDSQGTLISSDLTATNLGPGTYSVSVTDQNNCTTSISLEVTEPEPVVGFLGEITDPACFEDFGVINIDSAAGGVPGYRFQVNTSPAQDISIPFNIIPGNHIVRVFDQNGCEWSTNVTINSASELTVDAGPDIEIPLGRSTDLRAEIANVTPIDTIIWTPGNTLSCILNNCQEIRVSPVQDQRYEVTVIDVNGCTASDDVFVRLQSSRNVYIPNAIYPNSQITGNAFLRIFTGDGVQSIDYFRVFDRWGTMVHEERNLIPSLSGAGTWDGRFQGQDLLPGVYVYVVKLTYIDNEEEIRKGDVTLIR